MKPHGNHWIIRLENRIAKLQFVLSLFKHFKWLIKVVPLIFKITKRIAKTLHFGLNKFVLIISKSVKYLNSNSAGSLPINSDTNSQTFLFELNFSGIYIFKILKYLI